MRQRRPTTRLIAAVVGMGGLVASGLLVAEGSSASTAFRTTDAAGPNAGLPMATGDIPDPAEYFGFEMGAEGKLAAYPDVLAYMQMIADESDRVDYESIGKTTMGNEYATVLISSPQNLERIDELVEINQQLSDPRNTTPEQAAELAQEGVPFYHLEATIHSSEVGNGQAINDIVYRLATEDSDFTEEVLTNSVIVLVPSQNPDGQHLIIDHFNETAGTDLARTYPDLYHKYTGHDDNRDWTMFTQVEAQYRLDLIKQYRPAVVHIMHQMGNRGKRIFVPPYGGITAENVPANMNASAAAVGQHAARALAAEDKRGVGSLDYHIFWTLEQPVGFFPFTGSAVYLTEIASAVDYAYPQVSDDGSPLGPQQARQSMIEPYDSDVWTLRDIVEYAKTATYAGMEYTAQNGASLLYDNLFSVPYEYQTEGVPSGTYAFVVDADQRDPYATYEMLERLEWTQVEIHQATAPFSAGGNDYGEGSYVILMEQPRGNWAHQVLGVDDYPEVRDCDTCPVLLPYAEATTSLPIQLGVSVQEVSEEFDAELALVEAIEVPEVEMPRPPRGRNGAYLLRPESYGTIQVVTALQDAHIPTWRAGEEFEAEGDTYPAGTYIIPGTAQARTVLASATLGVGLEVDVVDRSPRVAGVELKPQTRVGLYRGTNNMPGGWDMWLMDEYGVNYNVVRAQDFQNSLNDLYDTIVLSHGISQEDIVEGLSSDEYDDTWAWAYGVGSEGWEKLKQFVTNGGTLLAIGNSVGTARDLLDLPITEALPRGSDEFFTGGSLINNTFDNDHMVGWGMPETWPVWLYRTQAWEPTDGAGADLQVVSSYPTEGDLLASGYLRGEDHLRGADNVLSFEVGEGQVVTYGSEVTFRTLPRSQFNLVYNAVYGGPAVEATALQILRLDSQFDN